MNTEVYSSDQKKVLSAVCGLFCPSCFIFIGQRESPEMKKQIAELLMMPVEMLRCDGCRAKNRFYYCENDCKMFPCAKEKGLDFCVECEDYPCDILKTFQAEMPHRLELWASQDRINEVGYEQWFDEMMGLYSCPECNTINSAYHPACRQCGTTPSCGYIEKHKEEIETHPFNKNR